MMGFEASNIYRYAGAFAKPFQKRVDTLRGVRMVMQNGFWFVDIPRTASSSLKVELAGAFGAAHGKLNIIETEFGTRQLFPDHLSAMKMRKMVGGREWDRLYSFTFVRNPFDRILSLYFYLLKVRNIPEGWSFPEFVRRLATADASTKHFAYDPIRWSAADFILGPENEILVKEIFRFEDRAIGLERIAERIGMKGFSNLRVQSASPYAADYKRFYDQETRSLVEMRFRDDLEMFGYAF